MYPFITTSILNTFCLLLVACGSNGYDPGTSPSSVNLPSDLDETGTYLASNAYPGLSFDDPLLATGIPGDTRIAVAEQGGRVFVIANDSSASSKHPVLDISSKVLFAGEQGLLGLAFDPDFEQNRLVYLNYSANQPRRNVIARMHWDEASDRIDVASEKTIIEIEQPYSNHNGGSIEFGPDGYLYIGVGDGGSGGDPRNLAQNQSTLLGKMLRLDVHTGDPAIRYNIPPDNPFTEVSGVRPEIFANGLRNPFRFSFDRQTGELWAGDVGQNAVEEIDIIRSGGNYGWRVYEGSQEYNSESNTLPGSAFTPPVFEYTHDEGSSVTGGVVYRGSKLGALAGRYIYGDYVSGSVWALTLDGNRVTANSRISTVANPTAFGTTNDGELLVVSRSGAIFNLAPKE